MGAGSLSVAVGRAVLNGNGCGRQNQQRAPSTISSMKPSHASDSDSSQELLPATMQLRGQSGLIRKWWFFIAPACNGTRGLSALADS